MKNLSLSLFIFANLFLVFVKASAHPGSSIAVDQQGDVYFTHTGHGCGKIDPQGKFSYIHNSNGGHWLCLDLEGTFSRTQPKYSQRITPDGVKPAVIFADGGSPIAVLPDRYLYYVSNDEKMTPGGLQLTRQSTDGHISIFPPDGKKTTEKVGISGLAAGPDGSLYLASPNAISKLNKDGTFTFLAKDIALKDCDIDYPDHNPQSQLALPYLRGLAVDDHCTVFAAAVACHAVVKISPNGKVETILKVERPWSPTGVAVYRGDVYILEYTNANGDRDEGWRARIRKLSHDGQITTLWTAEPDERK